MMRTTTSYNPAKVASPVDDYGMENSPEWDYFQQQVADFRAGRSAYRDQRTKEGSSVFKLSDKEYKKTSDKYYSGLLDQINANRIEGIGEFNLSTRVGRDDPSLINYNPNKTRGYTFSREGRMEEIGSDRISDYPDVDKETTYNRASKAIDELLLKKMGGAVGTLTHGILGDKLKQDLKSKIDQNYSGRFGKGLSALSNMGIIGRT